MAHPLTSLIEAFKQLPEKEKKQFVQMVFNNVSENLELDSLRKDALANRKRECPHCRSEAIFANGRLKGMQRYKCKSCEKNFSDSTGTALASIKKPELWLTYIRQMFEGKSLVQCAKATGIAKQTAFDWRHKILARLKHEAPESFAGICEMDDVFFNYSEKGSKNLKRKARKRGNDGISEGVSKDKVAVLLTADRSKSKDIQVIKRGRIRKQDLNKAVGNRIKKGTILCTDSHRSFTGFAKEKRLAVKNIHARKGQHVINKTYHIQHVNQMASGLKKWMAGFNGVATKYLQNYMNWYLMLDRLKNHANQTAKFTIAILAAPILIGSKSEIISTYIN